MPHAYGSTVVFVVIFLSTTTVPALGTPRTEALVAGERFEPAQKKASYSVTAAASYLPSPSISENVTSTSPCAAFIRRFFASATVSGTSVPFSCQMPIAAKEPLPYVPPDMSASRSAAV